MLSEADFYVESGTSAEICRNSLLKEDSKHWSNFTNLLVNQICKK